MAIVINEDDVHLINPDAPSENEIIFDVRFECSQILKSPMRWEVKYVTSTHSYDQILANTLVGPVSVGTSRFALRAEHPKLDDLPIDEINLAALLVCVYFNDQEFYRIGYILFHELPADFNESKPEYKNIIRHISMDKTDITTKVSQIKWT